MNASSLVAAARRAPRSALFARMLRIGILAAAVVSGAAQADALGARQAGDPAMLGATSITLLSESVLTRGSQSFSFDLSAPGAGTFEIRLTDLGWPERLAGLSFSLSTAAGVQRSLQAPGLLTLEIGAAGRYFGNVATRTQGTLGMGLYSLDVRFAEAALPVPLPASGWLLTAVAAALAGLLHRSPRPVVERAGRRAPSDALIECAA